MIEAYVRIQIRGKWWRTDAQPGSRMGIMHWENGALKLKNVILTFSSAIALLSLYVFSRFTVDDAFISWRYGKNLVDSGIWNYNPSKLDLTQAYTSPLYAVLSIIPNLFGWDVVLCFKILSTALLIAFICWFGKITKGSWLMLTVLIGLPATVIHIYGGLETFLFAILMSDLLIALYEEKTNSAIIVTLLLFLTRPEAWLLAVLLPLYYLVIEPRMTAGSAFRNPFAYISGIKLSPVKAVKVLGLLVIPLAAYFLFHSIYFGSILPNTFYVKSGGSYGVVPFIKFIFFAAPIVTLLFLKRIKLAFVAGIMFCAMAISYSTSNLMMDYSGRFAFHIFAPVYIFMVYLVSNLDGRIHISAHKDLTPELSVGLESFSKYCLLIFLIAFAAISSNELLHVATYYPRALVSHAELGKTINRISKKYGLRAFSFGDAGMAAYYSNINALDNGGLGSSAITKRGVSKSLLDKYQIDLVAFHTGPGGIRLGDYHQEPIYEWAISNNFQVNCDIYWEPDYTIRIYAKRSFDEIMEVCSESKKRNNVTDRELLSKAVITPPWKFWTE